jgi:hypothetical protein
MTPITQHPNEPRASYLLRVAAQYIRQYHPDGLIAFDEADCDGYCLATDCESEASDLLHAAGCPEADSVIRPHIEKRPCPKCHQLLTVAAQTCECGAKLGVVGEDVGNEYCVSLEEY